MNKVSSKLKQIFLSRHYVLTDESIIDKKTQSYYFTYLLNRFGIEIVNPEKLNMQVVKDIAEYMGISIPSSFYDNPQQTKYFSCDELLLEQIVSYVVIDLIEGNHNEHTNFDRIEIFKKVFPKYDESGSNESVIKKFVIISEEEQSKILSEIMDNYCQYTRPFSLDEKEEFLLLYKLGYYKNQKIQCKDNIFNLIEIDKKYGSLLDRKDIVKYSVLKLKNASFKKLSSEEKKTLLIIKKVIPLASECPMSKKQAKYFNKLCKECNIDNIEKETNIYSPYKYAIKSIKENNIMNAAKIYNENGSLLERNIKMLLARADENDFVSLIDMLPNKNPIVLYQLIENIDQDNKKRIFTFKHNNLSKSHIKTDYEYMWRKSRLDDKKSALLKNIVLNKIIFYYSNTEKLGKIYISNEFENIALPINTSASGRGLDVLPTGSRIKIRGKYIRTFCYWEKVFDIDTGVLFLKDNYQIGDEVDELSWRTYASKPFGNSALTSGDCRSISGAEYIDFDLEEVKDLGYKYALFCINGFGGKLNVGKIYCGYQDKNNLNTESWDPKNIELKINVNSDSNQYSGFAIDLEAKEIVILNLNIDGRNLVMDEKQIASIYKYLNKNYLKDINMAKIISCKGELVSSPELADVVFDSNYMAKENQKVIRPFDIEKLVKILNS